MVQQRQASVSQSHGSLVVNTTASAGFSYLKIPEFFQGRQSIARVQRVDGTLVVETNAWLAKERVENGRDFNHFIYVFDVNGGERYDITFTEQTRQALPPVIQALNVRTSHEGGSVGFIVQATDPNGTLPQLTMLNLPTGARFSDSGNGSGVFSWEPAIGQADRYELVVSASDGELTTQERVTVIIHPSNDRDGDGLDDQWELDHFGDLSRDGRVAILMVMGVVITKNIRWVLVLIR